MEAYSNQGAYASHGHGILAKGAGAFKQIYVDALATKCDAYTVFTNTPASGAMRAYGIQRYRSRSKATSRTSRARLGSTRLPCGAWI